MELPDSQLIKLIRGGDGSLFAVIVERYKVQVFNLMYRYTDSVEEASDLTQDVFCKAYEKLDRYRQKTSFFSWLYTMALNHARDWSRKRKRSEHKLHLFSSLPGEPGATPESEIESLQEIEQLQQALAGLADNRREMVILRYRHECSIRDLADIFGLSESAVKMRLKRALAELGQTLEQN
jgi:RNA polymerase sigma-70 factor (ECF subfamily)